MAKRIAPLIAIGVLTTALCVGVSLIYVGWEPDSHLTAVGVAAMVTGLLAALMLGLGLALLVLNGRD